MENESSMNSSCPCVAGGLQASLIHALCAGPNLTTLAVELSGESSGRKLTTASHVLGADAEPQHISILSGTSFQASLAWKKDISLLTRLHATALLLLHDLIPKFSCSVVGQAHRIFHINCFCNIRSSACR